MFIVVGVHTRSCSVLENLVWVAWVSCQILAQEWSGLGEKWMFNSPSGLMKQEGEILEGIWVVVFTKIRRKECNREKNRTTLCNILWLSHLCKTHQARIYPWEVSLAFAVSWWALWEVVLQETGGASCCLCVLPSYHFLHNIDVFCSFPTYLWVPVFPGGEFTYLWPICTEPGIW